MILLLGQGYIGSAIIEEMKRREWRYSAPHDHKTYNSFRELNRMMWLVRPNVVINCCAYVHNGIADECEDAKSDTMHGNLVFPTQLSNACESHGIPLMHISTGCLFNGTNKTGWTEDSTPHLSWRARSDCGTYVASKQLAEEVVSQYQRSWIFRVRLPFDGISHRRNYITKLLTYQKLVEATNSLTHRGDFASAVLDSFERQIPFGTYNATNEGAISSRDIVARMQSSGIITKEPVWWDMDDFQRTCARTPKSNCLLSVEKLKAAGIHMPHVSEAIDRSLSGWRNS